MTNSKNTYNSLNNETLSTMRLVFSVALIGMMSAFTHGYYLGVKPMSLPQVAKLSEKELETHTGTDYSSDRPVADPRHIRGIRRAEET